MGRLEGKTAIITGAASKLGFGYATGLLFGREGANIVLTDILADEVQERASELARDGLPAIGLAHDVTDSESWDIVVAATIEHFGRVDVLVNNAGISPLGTVLTTERALWDRVIGINLTGVFLGCQAVIRQMLEQGDGGSVINISSTAGISALPNVAAYTASKGGVRMLTKAVALEVANQNIRVNSVHPGQMNTEMAVRAAEKDPGLIRHIEESIPMEHIGEPDDIATINLFLASDEAKYITGSEFVVDGGSTAGRKGS